MHANWQHRRKRLQRRQIAERRDREWLRIGKRYDDMDTTTDQRDDLNTDELPSAYRLATGDDDGRYYPMRFGLYFKDSHAMRVSFAQRADAVQFCWFDQHWRERNNHA